jgi:uncharacterized protein YlxP (DUF503 family)
MLRLDMGSWESDVAYSLEEVRPVTRPITFLLKQKYPQITISRLQESAEKLRRCYLYQKENLSTQNPAG